MELVLDLFTGRIKVGMMDSLPIPRVDMLIVNNIVGARVRGDLVAVVSPERLNKKEKDGDVLLRRTMSRRWRQIFPVLSVR